MIDEYDFSPYRFKSLNKRINLAVKQKRKSLYSFMLERMMIQDIDGCLERYYKNSNKNPNKNPNNRGLHVVVIGGSGGIGGAIVHQLLDDSGVDTVYSCSRSRPSFEENVKLISLTVDLREEASIQYAVDRISNDNKTIDIVLVCTGLLHDNEGVKPEKALNDLDSEHFLKVITINTLGPALIAKYFLPLFSKRENSFFGMISARVGSISDNELGGWYSYRASKAALNMLVKNIAIEYKRKCPKLIVAGLHPGTVDTSLSFPFQKNIKPTTLFTPKYSATRLLSVINNLSVDDSGLCFAWDGKVIPA